MTRSLLKALMAVAAVGLAGACGEGGLTVDAGSVSAAAERTIAADTMRFVMTIDMHIPGEGDVSLPAEGVLDVEGARSQVTMDMSQFMADAGAPPELAGEMVVIMDGNTMYMSIPGGEDVFGAEWVSVDLERVTGLDLAGFSGGTNDPGAMLASLSGAGDATDEGRETVNDVETTHYVATFTMRDALESAGPGNRERIERFLDTVGLPDELLDAAMTTDVWIDDDGLIRRMSMDMGYLSALPDAPEDVSGSMTMDFFDFGEPVTIDVPADALDVTEDIAEVMGD